MTVPIPFGEQALAACLDVLRPLTPHALDRPTPCTEFTVRDLGEHLILRWCCSAASPAAN